MSERNGSLLIVHSSDELYGSDRMLLEVVQALGDLWKVEVWLPVDHQDGRLLLFKELVRHGVAVRHVDLPILRRAWLKPSGILRFLRLTVPTWWRLRKAAPQRLYLMTSACLLLAPLARMARIRRIALHIQEPWTSREAPVLRALARLADQRIAISETVAHFSGLSPTAIQVVPNAVPHPTENLAVPAQMLQSPAPHYVVASRWNGHKGHRTLLRAWQQAGCPGTLFVLGGPPPSGAQVSVPQLVDQFVQQPQTVQVIGEVPDPERWIAAADGVILPTDSIEGFGLVAIEAFRHGTPAIVSDCGGPSEIVQHGVTGLIFPPGDSQALADLLAGTTTEQLRQMGTRARQEYLQKYTPEHFHSRIRELLSGRRART